ncbi:MAG: putative signal transducing protein [Gaiellaceae bacterium]
MNLVTVAVARNEAEAELLRGRLAAEGIDSMQRQTNFGAGAADGWAVGGQREVLVREADAEEARRVLERGDWG